MAQTATLLRPLLFSLSALALGAGLLAQKPLPADRAQGAGSVKVEDTRKWLHHLAGPELAGRGTGQEGFRLAAEYVRDHFQALGLEPGVDGKWFQDMPWMARSPKADACKVTFTAGDKKLEIPAERLAGSANAAVQAEGEVVLIATMEAEDLEDVALEGKVAVVLLPAEEVGDGRRGARAQFQAMRMLQGKNAAAVLLVQTGDTTGGLQGSSGPGAGNPAARGRNRGPSSIRIGGKDRAALLELAAMNEAPKSGAHTTKVMARITVEIEEKQAPAMNVVGILRGTDPQLKNEFVVIGSHLDHLGRRGDTVYPGADDDGSGTTGVLAVSQMFAKNKEKPRRSILFVCFCGEELGLLGSRHFAENLPIPAESIVSELQMDMIGRDEEENAEDPRSGEKAEDNRNTVHLIGTKQLAPALHDLCMARNENAGLDIEWDQEGMFSRSDHANFARLGIPIAFFFTGLHKDYHQPSDTPDKIHYEKLLRVATWVYDIGFELAKQDARPMIDPKLWNKYRDKGRETPAAPMMPEEPAKAGGK